ncbi:FAD-dependent oxidoreductase [Methylovorus sp. MM2]|uniref:NAD(P)/FAD-dependent oxidoreductase n=1 Tax=Methylovorus sp. MM2 TaxID=1848038 RepID=UPI0007DFA919|nr:FAD-dependent oxidoreductase [Methylovorus sp. MM2]OAM51778.1 FAD-dependent oxidoreductase [Methylovorus sp. MM2]
MSQRVVIAGGGIVGCLTAMELVTRGYEVTIVERNKIASQTSGESSWAGAGVLFPLLPWMYSEPVNALTLAGASLYPEIAQRLLDETGIDSDLLPSGFLLLPPFDVEIARQWCDRHHFSAHPVSASSFGIQSVTGDDALWLPSVSQIRPPYLMLALRAWLEKNHVTLLEHTELTPLKETTSLDEWKTVSGETLKADKFVVTSGAWSFELLKETAQKLNIKPMRGQILLYQPEKNLEQIVYRDGFYMVPRKDGYLLAGSTLEDVGFDASTTAKVRDEISHKAEAIMPELKGMPIIKHWSGLRPGTPDNLPTIAPHPHIENLYLNTGHFRYGLTMAPISAQITADLISGQQSELDISAYAYPV